MLGFSPAADDSSTTSISIGVGGGSYAHVSRDCSGNVTGVEDVSFREAAVAVDHYTPVFHIGLAGGVVPARDWHDIFGLAPLGRRDGVPRFSGTRGVYFIRPVLGFDFDAAALDLGLIFASASKGYQTDGASLVGAVRLGMRDGLNFRFRLGSDLPLMSGAPGIANFGLGFPLWDPRFKMYLGLGGGPFDGPVYGMQFQFPVGRALSFEVAGSISTAVSTEYGLSMKTKVVF
jgi:hypothetical protein